MFVSRSPSPETIERIAMASYTLRAGILTTAVFLAQRPIGEQIDVLIDQVDALEADEVINGGQANSLRAKLKAMQKSAANGRIRPAVNQANAFINEVEAFMSAGLLSPEQGEQLISTAEEIIQSLT